MLSFVVFVFFGHPFTAGGDCIQTSPTAKRSLTDHSVSMPCSYLSSTGRPLPPLLPFLTSSSSCQLAWRGPRGCPVTFTGLCGVCECAHIGKPSGLKSVKKLWAFVRKLLLNSTWDRIHKLMVLCWCWGNNCKEPLKAKLPFASDPTHPQGLCSQRNNCLCTLSSIGPWGSQGLCLHRNSIVSISFFLLSLTYSHSHALFWLLLLICTLRCLYLNSVSRINSFHQL